MLKAQTSKVIALGIILLIIGIAIGYFIKPVAPAKTITVTATAVSTTTATVTKTVGAPGAKTITVTTSIVRTVTKTITKTVTTLASPTPTRKVKVAVLFDVGGRGDLSFNDMAWLGAERASKELGVELSFLTPKSLADMKPLLEQLSKSKKYDLLVLVGFLWTTPLNETADKFPEQKFALIDATTAVSYTHLTLPTKA